MNIHQLREDDPVYFSTGGVCVCVPVPICRFSAVKPIWEEGRLGGSGRSGD